MNHKEEEYNQISDHIRNEVSHYPVPDSLKPEQITDKLSRTTPVRKFAVRRPFLYGGVAAACLALVVSASTARSMLSPSPSSTGDSADSTESANSRNTTGSTDYSASDASGKDSPDTSAPIVSAGIAHTTYSALFEKISASYKQLESNQLEPGSDYAVAEDSSVTSGVAAENSVDFKKNSSSLKASSDDSVTETGGSAYTDTDIQVDGVMESDIVKTDGHYIYVLHNSFNSWYCTDDSDNSTPTSAVTIYEVSGKKAKKIGEITIAEKEDMARAGLWDMYLSDKTLFLVGSEYSRIPAEDSNDSCIDFKNSFYQNYQTVILSYNISDPAHPKKLSELTQSGDLSETRLSDGYLYVFSNHNIRPFYRNYFYGAKIDPVCSIEDSKEDTTTTDASDSKTDSSIGDTKDHISTAEGSSSSIGDTKDHSTAADGANSSSGYSVEDTKDYIPTVDGEVLSEDRLYLPEDSDTSTYLVMTSVSVQNPDHFADKAATLGWSSTRYVGTENIYMIQPACDDSNKNKSVIDKYAYEDGQFTYLSHAKVDGSINDSYYMHEYKDHFVYVYTLGEWKKDEYVNSNGLAILDKNLKPTGAIRDLGLDETIYASYFVDHMAYFVTYRNTDPVFAVDLSDVKNPRLLSELKLPGFSSYLHSFGTDASGNHLLIGIGRGNKNATLDDEDASQDQVKISLFTVKKDGSIEETQTIFEPSMTWSHTEDRHAIFVDEENGLIGYPLEQEIWNSDESAVLDYKLSYILYRYHDGRFERILEKDMGEPSFIEIRGLRISDTFFIIDTWKKQNTLKGYELK